MTPPPPPPPVVVAVEEIKPKRIRRKTGRRKEFNPTVKEEILTEFYKIAKQEVSQKMLIMRGWKAIAFEEAMTDWITKKKREIEKRRNPPKFITIRRGSYVTTFQLKEKGPGIYTSEPYGIKRVEEE